MSRCTSYSPSELVELYPEVQKLGWTAQKIVILCRAGLLVGFLSGKENKAMIYEESFISLIKYVNKVNRDRDTDILGH